MKSRLLMLLACFTLVIALLPGQARAQTTTTFGVQGGINIANVDFTASDSDDLPEFKSRTRAVGGVFVAWDFNPNAGLQIDFLYSQRGTKASATFEEDGESFDFDLEVGLDYIDIPILFRANMPASDAVTFRVFGGPAIAFKVSDDFKQTVNGMDFSDEDAPQWKSYDFSLVVGGAAQFGQFFVDARYSWGLVNVLDEDEGEDVKHRTFGVMVGFAFK